MVVNERDIQPKDKDESATKRKNLLPGENAAMTKLTKLVENGGKSTIPSLDITITKDNLHDLE